MSSFLRTAAYFLTAALALLAYMYGLLSTMGVTR